MGRDAESELEELFDIESDLRTMTEDGVATPAVRDTDSGMVSAVERVPATEVPDEYPIQTTGERALALEVEPNPGTKTVVFVNWPDEGNNLEQIEALLDATDVSFESFADIYGERVPLEVRDGYVVVPVDSEATTRTYDADGERSSQTVGILALAGLWTWGAADLTVSGLTWVGWMAWLTVGFFTLGAAELDRKWVTETTEWSPSMGWPFAIACCPLGTLPLYFYKRFRAQDGR